MITDEERALAGRLARVYGKLLGEVARIENPPKRAQRLIPDREAYAAGAEERAARKQAIEGVLPHVVATAKFLDPDWSEANIKPIKPNKGRRVSPPGGGWIGAAFVVLRAARHPLTLAEIAAQVADRYGYDMSTVELRQLTQNAIRGSLLNPRYGLICDKGRPERWSLPDLNHSD